MNAILRIFESSEEDSTAALKVAVAALLSEQMQTSVVCVDAKRLQKIATGCCAGLMYWRNVLVQFENKADKQTMFKANNKLVGTLIDMNDDLTRLQQERKNAAWAGFKAFKPQGIRTQWRAEKLFVKQGEHFVEHKVPCL